MAKNINDYLEKKGDSLIAKAPVRIILEKSSFDSGVSVEIDSFIQTFGIFAIESIDGKDKFKCSFPLRLKLNVINREFVDDNLYLNYDKGNVIIDLMGYFPHVKEAIKFVDYYTTAKLTGLTTEELTNLLIVNLSMNGIDQGVPSELIEALTAELTRWKQDISIPFRLKFGKVPNDDFTVINIKDVSRVSSVFGAVSFEDTKKAVQAAVSLTRSGKANQMPSPVETVLRF